MALRPPAGTGTGAEPGRAGSPALVEGLGCPGQEAVTRKLGRPEVRSGRKGSGGWCGQDDRGQVPGLPSLLRASAGPGPRSWSEARLSPGEGKQQESAEPRTLCVSPCHCPCPCESGTIIFMSYLQMEPGEASTSPRTTQTGRLQGPALSAASFRYIKASPAFLSPEPGCRGGGRPFASRSPHPSPAGP